MEKATKKIKKTDLKECCRRFYLFFDPCGDDLAYPHEYPLTNFIDLYHRIESLKISDKVKWEILDILNDLRDLAFGIGFVFGQTCELTYPEAQKDVKAILKGIRDNGLLPYLPKEKKAA